MAPYLTLMTIMVKYLNRILGKIGPGIMALGFTIGTGSVTSMIVAGNEHGMDLLWVLLLSCFFSWILMIAYGRYNLVTGETALYAMKKHIKYGNVIGIIIITVSYTHLTLPTILLV